MSHQERAPTTAAKRVDTPSAAQSTSSAADVRLRSQLRSASYDDAVQMLAPGGGEAASSAQAAAATVTGAGGALPHHDRIQAAFGAHHVGHVQAHVGGAAAGACDAMGAHAYASGATVGFKSAPSLHTAAHEAAHVVQQAAGVSLKGGVGQVGDTYERHADAVADAVVSGRSAEGLLDAHVGSGAGGAVQRSAAGGQVQLLEKAGFNQAIKSGIFKTKKGRTATAAKLIVAELSGSVDNAFKWAREDGIEAAPEVFRRVMAVVGPPSPIGVERALAAFGEGARPFIYGAIEQTCGIAALHAVLLEGHDLSTDISVKRVGAGTFPISQHTILIPGTTIRAYFDDAFSADNGKANYKAVLQRFTHAHPAYRAAANAAYEAKFGKSALVGALKVGGRKYVGRTEDLDAVLATFRRTLVRSRMGQAATTWLRLRAAHATYANDIDEVARTALGEAGFVEAAIEGDIKDVIRGGLDDAHVAAAIRSRLKAAKESERAVRFADLKQKLPLHLDLVRGQYADLGYGTVKEPVPGMKLGARDLSATTGQKALQTLMDGGPYTSENFTPKTGIGRFGAEYDPKTGALTIVSKVHFNYADIGGGTSWSNQQKVAFAQQFKNVCQQVWARKFMLSCTKAGFEEVVAIPTVRFEEVAAGDAHFSINAQQNVAEDDTSVVGGKKVKTSAGSSYVNPKDNPKKGEAWGDVQLQQFDVQDKFRDPLMHQYLHRAQSTMIAEAFKADRNRLVAALSSVGALDYANPSAAPPALSVKKVQAALEKVQIPGALATLHGVDITGHCDTVEDVSAQGLRASKFKRALRANVADYPLSAHSGDTRGATVTVAAAELTPAIREQYVANWQRISAAHEFGHMLGLSDEYATLESKELADVLGTHPSGTDVSHLTTGGKAGTQAGKQKALSELCQGAGVAAPLMEDTQGGRGRLINTSIMTNGWEVWPSHYVTVWQCLGEMMSGVAGLSASDWKING